LVLKDTKGGKTSVIERLLVIPSYEAEKFSSSSIMLADRIRTAGRPKRVPIHSSWKGD